MGHELCPLLSSLADYCGRIIGVVVMSKPRLNGACCSIGPQMESYWWLRIISEVALACFWPSTAAASVVLFFWGPSKVKISLWALGNCNG